MRLRERGIYCLPNGRELIVIAAHPTEVSKCEVRRVVENEANTNWIVEEGY